MYNVNVKKDTTNLNIDRADLSDSLTTKVGILLILVATISLSFSFPVSMVLNPQLAGAGTILPSHTFAKVQHTSSSQLMGLQFFPSNSDRFVRQVAFISFHLQDYLFPFQSRLFPLPPLSHQIPLMP